MSINSQIEKINAIFESFRQEYQKNEIKIQKLKQSQKEKIQEIELKYSNKEEANRTLYKDVRNYFDIVSDNTNKKIKEVGISPEKPDIEKLTALLQKVNLNSSYDPVADQVVNLVGSYLAYINKDLRDIERKKHDELATIDVQFKKEVQKIQICNGTLQKNCQEYLKGKDIQQLKRTFRAFRDGYAIFDTVYKNWSETQYKDRGAMLMGFQTQEMKIPNVLCTMFKQCMGIYYNEANNTLSVPTGYSTTHSQDIYAEYSILNEEQTKCGVQAVLLNYLRHFKLSHIKISIFDYVYYSNALLGPLSPLSGLKNGSIDSVPTNEKGIAEKLRILTDYYKNEIWPKLGSSSVFEYNQHVYEKERIPFRIIIINRDREKFFTANDSDVMFLQNNAQKLGITFIHLSKCEVNGGSKGTDREKKYLINAKDYIRIITDKEGKLYIENDIEWLPFRWLLNPLQTLPAPMLEKITEALKPTIIGTKYFNRYKLHMPRRATGKRKPVKVPFAIRDDDTAVSCSFSNELFAVYMMGTTRSGKSTLLNTMAIDLCMNYHPDELELWLIDFGTVTFKRYIKNAPPHVKYVLLGNERDYVFDIVDHILKVMSQREFIFSQNGWEKITDVPLDIYMPYIFVMIDEFSDMSDILKSTKGEGYGSDYTIKLGEILRKAAKYGFMFIFASQNYTSGVEGLTDAARKQIQQRIALKGSYQEIKATLEISNDQISPRIEQYMRDLPVYQSIFKTRSTEGILNIEHLYNIYAEGTEIDNALYTLLHSMMVNTDWEQRSDNNYMNKKPVYIDGVTPCSYESQYPAYKENDYNSSNVLSNGDMLLYPGVPRSFHRIKPFRLSRGFSENILIAGGNPENEFSILLSLYNYYKDTGKEVSIWAYERNSIYEKYKNIIPEEYVVTDVRKVCSLIEDLKSNIKSATDKEQMIFVLGYEQFVIDMEILMEDAEKYTSDVPQVQENKDAGDFSVVKKRIAATNDPEEKKRIVAEYNEYIRKYNEQQSLLKNNRQILGWKEMPYIIKRAPYYGTHFVFCFERAENAVQNLKMDLFKHKMLFSMSLENSINISGTKKANLLKPTICLYTNGNEEFTFQAHLHKNVPCNGWKITDDDAIVVTQ